MFQHEKVNKEDKAGEFERVPEDLSTKITQKIKVYLTKCGIFC